MEDFMGLSLPVVESTTKRYVDGQATVEEILKEPRILYN